MIYIVDNIFNYIIYLFILHFGFRMNERKNKFFPLVSMLVMLAAGIFNTYFDSNSPIIYIMWSVCSICLFFEDSLVHLFLLSAGLMYSTGITDTFSVILVQIVLIGGGISGTDITWWMESAYVLSFFVYLSVYLQLLKKNDIYLCDISWKYLIALLLESSIFQMFYNFVFFFFDLYHASYGWDAYLLFIISVIGVIYSIFLMLSLAIKNVQMDRQNMELQSLAKMQKQQYDYQLQQSVSIRSFKHDLANHIGVLRELANEQKPDAIKEYIEEIWKIQSEFDIVLHTGDSFLDVIINYYAYLTARENIDYAVFGKLTGEMPMEMFDITTLMGNVLQNAIEATEIADNPTIRIELIEHRTEIFVIVKNSTVQKDHAKIGILETSKENKLNHGFGLKNVQAVIKKYHGECYMEFVTEEGRTYFIVSISLPKENYA